MTDPVFKDRAELEAWARAAANLAVTLGDMRLAIDTLRRVTLAHSHLFEEGK